MKVPPLRMPLEVLLDEALRVARFVEANGKSVRRKDVVVQRGLDLAGDPELAGPIAREIRTLVEDVHAAQRAFLAEKTRSAGPELRREARRALSDLRATLQWLALDDRGQQRATVLSRIRPARKTRHQTDVLAQALHDHAATAERWTRGRRIDGATPEVLARARALREALLRVPPVHTPSLAARMALKHRNQLVAQLGERVARVRAAARYVWRAEPAIVRTVTSAWERTRKRASTRKRPDSPGPQDGASANAVRAASSPGARRETTSPRS